mmetsp:Transcript_59546/g.141580  ORF Transcript_59546/g.141580 Transcript_59546/m.141580 type:complete len:259 (+) Transcript_59546:519-1295(+)
MRKRIENIPSGSSPPIQMPLSASFSASLSSFPFVSARISNSPRSNISSFSRASSSRVEVTPLRSNVAQIVSSTSRGLMKTVSRSLEEEAVPKWSTTPESWNASSIRIAWASDKPWRRQRATNSATGIFCTVISASSLRTLMTSTCFMSSTNGKSSADRPVDIHRAWNVSSFAVEQAAAMGNPHPCAEKVLRSTRSCAGCQIAMVLLLTHGNTPPEDTGPSVLGPSLARLFTSDIPMPRPSIDTHGFSSTILSSILPLY